MNRQPNPRGCLFTVLELLGIAPASGPVDAALPYRRKDYLLSKAERSFYGALQNAVGGEFLVFSKVRLADLVFIPRGTEKRQSHFNRIQSKHVDFVLCDRAAVRPLLAIELDDSSHSRAERRDRDSFVDAALGAAGLPILHVPARAGYDVQQLAGAVQRAIQT